MIENAALFTKKEATRDMSEAKRLTIRAFVAGVIPFISSIIFFKINLPKLTFLKCQVFLLNRQ